MKKASAHFNIQKWLESKKPLTPIISIKTYIQNFEIAILFKIVRQSENYVFEDTPPYIPQGKSCKLYPGGIKVVL